MTGNDVNVTVTLWGFVDLFVRYVCNRYTGNTPEIHDFKTSLASSLSLEKSSSSFLGSIQYHAGIHGTKLIGPGPKKLGRSGTGPEPSQF